MAKSENGKMAKSGWNINRCGWCLTKGIQAKKGKTDKCLSTYWGWEREGGGQRER